MGSESRIDFISQRCLDMLTLEQRRKVEEIGVSLAMQLDPRLAYQIRAKCCAARKAIRSSSCAEQAPPLRGTRSPPSTPDRRALHVQTTAGSAHAPVCSGAAEPRLKAPTTPSSAFRRPSSAPPCKVRATSLAPCETETPSQAGKSQAGKLQARPRSAPASGRTPRPSGGGFKYLLPAGEKLDLLEAALRDIGWAPCSNADCFDFKWASAKSIQETEFDHAALTTTRSLLSHCRRKGRTYFVNHFGKQRCRGVSNKRHLLQHLRTAYPAAVLDCWFPRSYDLLDETDRNAFVLDFSRTAPSDVDEHLSKKQTRPKNASVSAMHDGLRQPQISSSRNMWLIKPSDRARGEGIVVSSSLQQLLLAAKSLEWHAVVQKYVETPLTASGCKMDMRIWVLVTRWDPMQAWLVEEPYMRVSLRAFDLDENNFSNRCMHLTNSDQQEMTNCRPLFEDEPHRWTLLKFQSWLMSQGGYRPNVWKDEIWPKLVHLVRQVLHAMSKISGQSTLSPNVRSFELFGFDVLLDASLHPWLLEVNCGPTLCHDAGPALKASVKGSLHSAVLLLTRLRDEGHAWLPSSRVVEQDPAGIRLDGIDGWTLILNK